MRLLILGALEGHLTAASQIALARGAKVSHADTIEKGLQALRSGQGADLVITDVEMPRMDGFTLCETIRSSRRFSQLPVVLVTSLEDADHRARGVEAGADAYVVKSGFDQEALLAIVRDLLAAGRS